MKLILIRHALTESNEQGKYLGKTDELLSAKGIASLQQKKWEGLYPRADFVAASPMKRCVQTAKLLYEDVTPFLVEGFEEIDFGSFEGKTFRELSGESAYQSWLNSGGTLAFPKGESREEFIARCWKGFANLCEVLKQQEATLESVVLIVHGGTIMAILSVFTKQEFYSFQCKNAEGYSCELEIAESIKLHNIQKLEEIGK